MPSREAAAKAVAVRADELWEHADNVLDVGDIERVHDMRVATRRLRAVLEIFAPCFPKRAHRRRAATTSRRWPTRWASAATPTCRSSTSRPTRRPRPTQDRPGVDVLVSRLRSRQAGANADLAAALADMERSDLRGRLLTLVEEARAA